MSEVDGWREGAGSTIVLFSVANQCDNGARSGK